MDLRVTVFQHGRESFLRLLREHRIEFAAAPMEPGSIRASGELLVLLGAAIPAVATILAAWLTTRPKAKSAERRIILRSGTKSIDIEGYTPEEVKKLLEGMSQCAEVDAVVIQTQKDEE